MFSPPEHRLTRAQWTTQPSPVMACASQAQNYANHYQLGNQLRQAGQLVQAKAEYKQAIRIVEQMRAELVIDQRADFLASKQRVYEAMVELCLTLQRPAEALTYAEMVKSRTLHDLLVRQIDLDAQQKSQADWSWLTTLRNLRQLHQQLVESYQVPAQSTVRGSSLTAERAATPWLITNFEQNITNLWHLLLARNADHLPQAAPSPLSTGAVQACLPADTALVEYFTLQDTLVAFVVTAGQVDALRLPITLTQVQRALRFWQLNLKAFAYQPLAHNARLTQNAQQLLHQLYIGLLAPLYEKLGAYPKWIIVPHGPLHQLPFHALYNGQAYLVERHEINYLPRASMLPYCRQTLPATTATVALGYSANGRLPYAVQEANQVATLLDGQAFLEADATMARLRNMTPQARLLHLATHGNFRDDNPLFSGLALADGWLTSLDIFELRLRASLVTLSACQTGCHVVGGGDELLGLIRAFLATGTATVVAGLWAVEDSTTAHFMQHFYTKLATKRPKGEALRLAQLALLRGEAAGEDHAVPQRHPYFWAPFFLMGDAGLL